ncbi:unnamed protein product [Heligmosomoides polygyrus]|uniref:Uncharacterized protein n=1 Tax=Heligmosomoides polygyrus TaxID=6339 RepID=A0A183GC99_HELPZ|nr:unnamed protein product [Heligmosomoides polygyrus]
MSSFSYSRGSGAVLSLEGFELPHDQQERKPRKVRADDLAAVQDFCGAIDEAAGSVFNDVLNKIADFFMLSSDAKKIERSSLTQRKLRMGIVHCNMSDVDRITHGVCGRLGLADSDFALLKSCDTSVSGVVGQIRDGKAAASDRTGGVSGFRASKWPVLFSGRPKQGNFDSALPANVYEACNVHFCFVAKGSIVSPYAMFLFIDVN